MKIIHDWIKRGKNFHVGTAIFAAISKNEELKSLFRKGSNPHSQKILEKELLSFIDKPVPVIQKSNPEIEEIPISKDLILSTIRNKWLPLYQRMNYLRHELDKYSGNTQEMIAIRKPIAFEILELEQSCQDLWDKADEYTRTGKVPELDEPDEDDQFIVPDNPLDKAKAIENAKRNIRRNRKKINEDPKNLTAAMLYRKYKDFFFRLTGEEYKEKN